MKETRDKTLLVIFSLLIPLSVFAAEPLESLQAKTCIGFHSDTHTWGSYEGIYCPKNHAIFGTHGVFSRSRYSEGQSIFIGHVSCCPLPSSDILVDEHVMVTKECPENFVATSRTITSSGETEFKNAIQSNTEWLMRCTKINSKRYTLSTKTTGAHWGQGSSHWKERVQIQKGDIPLAIRQAMGRTSKFRWLNRGCIGQPPGSLFTAKKGKRCYMSEFRQLLFQGLPGDPEKGSPVPLFPRCLNSVDPFNPAGSCRKASR